MTAPAPLDPTLAPPSAAPGPQATRTSQALSTRRGRWIEGWNPEDHAQWEGGGRRIAQRNLVLSVFAEFLGFAVWASWSIVVPQLSAAGFALTVDQSFWLIAIPSLVGAALRIPYTFAVALFGGRNWTIVSALLLLVPTGAMVVVLQNPATPFGVMVAIAALAGFGGGNFASSMANISFFYPQAEKGKALGLNAAGGNLGTAVVQLAVPLVIVGAAGVQLERAGLMFIPFILLAAVLAWRFMDNLADASSDPRGYARAAGHRHTWIISFLYIGTFGSFIGFSGAFPTLLASTFPEVSLSLAFLGALVGSVARPLGGIAADRLGGARVTVGAFAVIGLGAAGALLALRQESFGLFFGSFLVLFTATGIGNGSVYRMIPAVFRHGAIDDDERAHRARAAAGCIGIAGAIGALGGFAVPRAFAASTSATGSIQAALVAFIAVYAVMAAVTWAVYARRGAFGAGVV